MWWFTLGSMLTISFVVYIASAAQVYTFSPFVMQRAAAAADEDQRARQQAPEAASVQWLKLWPGEAVSLLPIEVPVPTASALTAMPRAKQPDRAELNVPTSLSDLLSFYRTELATGGWHEVRSWMARPVTSGSAPGNAFSIFCRAAEGPALLVAIAHDPADGTSSLHLRVSAEQPTPCDAATMPTPGDRTTPGPGDGPSRRDRSLPPLS